MPSPPKKGEYLPIENYGIIGNLQTAALVSTKASIDFMCFPRFDAPTIFCRLLDAKKGGYFSIQPLMENMVTKQLYLPDTNVLVTRFLAEEGIAEILDYMPIEAGGGPCTLIRTIKTVRGKIRFRVHCAPRFHYAASRHNIKKQQEAFLFIPEDGQQPALRLSSNSPMKISRTSVVSDFSLEEGENRFFLLEEERGKTKSIAFLQTYVQRSLKATIDYWQGWIAQTTYKGPWQEIVRRSALTLKLLTSKEYGSMVAAPSFGLPEALGKARNWDYRYTWIRDAAFAMHAFLQLGFLEEARQFLNWVKKQSTDKELQLMFAIDGRTDLEEHILGYLEGYKGSRPVRIGNNAHRQTQMDIYGELLETLYIFTIHGGELTYDYWKTIEKYMEWVVGNWQQPDHSIWEVRGEKREFLFSRLMCWVALDRAIKIAEHFSFPYNRTEWLDARDIIYKEVYDDFWNEQKQAFVQSKGSENLDASVLLMPVLNMISPQAEKWQKTMAAIDRELKSDVLVYRYREQSDEIDGLKGREGTFSICSFWYVECLALAGKREEAREHFEKMMGYANHLGLFSEQIGMKGEHLGNFPQAFTHLALISAAIALNKPEHTSSASGQQYTKSMK